MDTYNASYHADPNQMYGINEWNETMPINYNQQNYMTNEARETSVESLNIDSMTVKSGQQYQHHEDSYQVKEESYILIWKYLEQIKSISAG